MRTTWQVRPGGREAVTSAASVRALLLGQRGVLDDTTAAFFAPDYERDLHDPLALSEMERAVDRIIRARDAGERIIVWGDYDADGVSSTAILVTALRRIGADVVPYLPHRVDDGYGVNQRVLEALAPEMQLLVTVDCGISNFAEVAWLTARQIDTIIIDHHTPPAELPVAYAIVHPQHPSSPYANAWLCGAGLAWKVACALYRDPRASTADGPEAEKWLLDLAVLGTVADVVPLIGENRTLVQFGLEVLRRTRRPGLRSCLSALRLTDNELTAEDIAFRIVPRLNAAGRVDHPQPALDLLLAETEAEAVLLVARLQQLNTQRQTLTRRVLQEAEQQITDLGAGVIFAASESWPSGIVGLAAGRLADKFGVPAIVVGRSGERYVGSARGPRGTNVLAMLRQVEAHLDRLGGHTQAAGFTVGVDALDHFKDALFESSGASTAPAPVPLADAVLAPSAITWELVEILRSFAPFGAGNAAPLFILPNLLLANWRAVGKDQQHAQLTFNSSAGTLRGIGFGIAADADRAAASGDTVTVLATVAESTYRGVRRLELEVKAIAPAAAVEIAEVPAEEQAHA